MTNFVVDDIGTVVNNMNTGQYWAPQFNAYFRGNPAQYLYGHELEITNQLLKQLQNPALKEQRYPLVALFLDIEQPIVEGVIFYKMNLVICTKTNPSLWASDRYGAAATFKTILQPLYDAFMKSLSDSGLFMWPSVADYPEHSKIDRPYYGVPKQNDNGTQQNSKNVFNDYLDAIQIKNLRVNQKIKNC